MLVNSTEEDDADTGGFFELAQQYWFYRAGQIIDMYWFLLLVPIGIIGNSLSMAVMGMKHNRFSSTCNYMMAISINDNILLTFYMYQWLLKNAEIQRLTDVVCKTVGPLMLIFGHNGTNLVLLMTFDKCFAVTFPHRSLSFSTPRRARVLITLTFLFTLIFDCPHFYLFGFIVSDCFAYTVKSIFTTFYVYLSFIITSMVPFVSLITMNFIIIKAVKNSRKLRTQNNTDSSNTDFSSSSSKNSKTKLVEQQLTRDVRRYCSNVRRSIHA